MEKIGKCFTVLAFMFIASSVYCDFHDKVEDRSFKKEWGDKKALVLLKLGQKKTSDIELYAAKNEIYRLTELLNIKGIGKKSLLILGDIMKIRFFYKQNCSFEHKLNPC